MFNLSNLSLRAAMAGVVTLMVALPLPAVAQAPATQAAASFDKQYVLRFGDSLNMHVVENEKLEVEEQPIRPDGRISLPLIGEMLAGGQTLPQLQERITKAYTRFFVDPHVVVNVAKFRPLRISVLGLVRSADTFEVPEPIHLLQAIAHAGGFDRERADLHRVLVLRAGGEARMIDAVAVLEGKVEDNVVLYDGDTVRVFEVDGPDWYRILPPLASSLSILGTAIVVISNIINNQKK